MRLSNIRTLCLRCHRKATAELRDHLKARRAQATPEGLTAGREPDERNAVITWRPEPGVVGYIVRWGIAPTKLYQTYQRFADQGTTLELRALTVGQAYCVAVESFDEYGVSALSAAVPIRSWRRGQEDSTKEQERGLVRSAFSLTMA